MRRSHSWRIARFVGDVVFGATWRFHITIIYCIPHLHCLLSRYPPLFMVRLREVNWSGLKIFSFLLRKFLKKTWRHHLLVTYLTHWTMCTNYYKAQILAHLLYIHKSQFKSCRELLQVKLTIGQIWLSHWNSLKNCLWDFLLVHFLENFTRKLLWNYSYRKTRLAFF